MPSRLLRPNILTSRKLDKASDAAEALWYRLMVVVDDHGTYWADPQIVASAAYPTGKRSAAVIGRRLVELSNVGLITLYHAEGEDYLVFANWPQRVRGEARFPAPTHEPSQLAATCGNSRQPATLVVDVDVDVDGDGDVDGSSDFERFWAVYPRRQGKGAAKKAWDKADVDGPSLVRFAEKFASDPNLPTDKKFIPLPATWLNQERWGDDPYPPRNYESGNWLDDMVTDLVAGGANEA